MKILFVCTGNTCRSPMAESYFNFAAKKIGLSAYTAESAGLFASDGRDATPQTNNVLKENGIPINHSSRQINRSLVENASAVYALTSSHTDILLKNYPEYAGKIFTLAEINDPFGGNEDIYRETFNQIKAAVDAVIAGLTESGS